ncbi:hypothetical protein GCM10009838_44290 [Catenulispora subtropica]|uniref:Uncharacterized protein n=1 Tax=Catenulispora subtropica TaxID=450798 RepID=A0ABP5DEH4_9ACTN
MTRVPVTGMSGTGKTTLLEELGRRGHRVVDAGCGDFHEVQVTEPSGRRSTGRSSGSNGRTG